MTKGKDLCDRLFQFSIDVIKFLREVKSTPETSVLKYQLTKSATSSGANYEESQAASSKADFRNKVGISLREMRESNYWMRIFKTMEIGDERLAKKLVSESDELKKILGSIFSKMQ